MNIALVCSSFFLNRSYQENIWAEQLVKAGHRVRVIYSGPRTTEPRAFQSSAGEYEVQQVRTRKLPRSVYMSRETASVVRQFKPGMMIIYGDKRFTITVCKDSELARVPMITTFSENLGMHEYDWRKPGISPWQRFRALGYAALRGGPIRVNCRRTDLIVNNTPNSRDIVLRLIRSEKERQATAAKMIDVPLGFSPDHIEFDPELRRRARRDLGIADGEIVVCTTSRFEPEKASSIRLVMNACRKLMLGNPAIRCMLVGLSKTSTSQQIEAEIAGGPFADRFIKQPFADRARMNQLLNAADIAVYNLITISCQEALGTGLVCCFADDGSFGHLTQSPKQAVFFKPFDADDLSRAINSATGLLEFNSDALRRERAGMSRWLGYDKIIRLIMNALNERLTPDRRVPFG